MSPNSILCATKASSTPRALARDGVRVELTTHAGLIHHFYGLGGVIPAAQAALERIGDEVRQAFAGIAG